MKKRILSWLLVLTMVVSLIPSTLITSAFAADVSGITQELTFGDAENEKGLNSDSAYTLTGTLSDKVIKVTNNAIVTLYLKGVTMTADTSPIQVESGSTLTLVVADNTDNTITCTATAANATNNGMTAGIHVPDGATLNIDTPKNGTGTGKLTVNGGYGGAGIGGKAGVGTNAGQTAASGKVGQTTYWVDACVSHDDRTEVKPKGGAAGTGGEQGNDAESAGAINILNGVVSATGGYGGAGIGGGMGAAGGSGKAGSAGENSDSKKMNSPVGIAQRDHVSSWDGDWGGAGGGAGGNGGTGGAGGNVSTINISGGTVNAVAGDRAAAIGGGAGGPGGAPGKGADGGHDKYRYEDYGGISPSDKALFHKRPTTTYDTAGNNAVGNWSTWELWGDAKVGRSIYSANAANNNLNWLYVSGLGGDGGRGADGQNGRGGAGGAGGNITISGGTVTTNGSVKIGGGLNGVDDTTSREELTAGNPGDMPPQVGNQQMYRDHDRQFKCWAYGGAFTGSNNIWMLVVDGWHGGAGGGAAAQEAEQAAGAKANITIDGATDLNASIWSDIVGSNGQLNAGVNRPKDTQGNDLYLYTLTVTEMDSQTPVSGAKVVLKNVKGTNGNAYTYTAVSNDEGKVHLWLPAAEYTLSGKDVSHETAGWIPSNKSVTFTVEKRDNQSGSVKIGANFTLTASKTDKVYFSNDDKPVKLQVDASSIEHSIASVKWFAEPIAGTANQYDAAADTTNNIKDFDDGYAAADAKGNAGTENVTGDKYTFEIPINENGRYWVKVTYETQGATSASIVNPITVTNIYRKYPVTVRSYVNEGLDSNGDEIVASDTGYAALPDAAGVTQNVEYGFAWDLNGYDAANLDRTKLLDAAIAPYDEITLYAKSTYHTWYKATLVGNSQLFGDDANDQGAVTGYLPIKLTLNPDFLTDKNTSCDTVNGAKDHSKYTIRYDARDGALDIVTITGTADGVADPFYTHTRSYTEAIDSDSITAMNWPEYKLVGVKVNGVAKTLDTDKDGNTLSSVTISDIHDKTGGFKNKIKTVEFIYQYNMSNVTINAYYEGTTTPVEGLSSYKEKMEIGKEYTPTAPAVDGHDNAGSNLKDGKFTPTGKNDSIIFYYTKSSGNVTYKAVDGEGNTLWTGSGKVNKGTVPNDVTPDYGITNMTKDDAVKTGYTKTSDGSDYGKGNKYDGVNDMTVTYTYKHITRNVVVKQIDSTNDKELNTAAAVAYNVGSYQTISAGTAPAGYEIVGEDSRVVAITEGKDDLVVKFYYRPSTTASVTIKLYEADDSGNKIAGKEPFQTMTVKVSYGQEQTINAPTITGWAVTGDDSKTINVKTGETAQEIEFLYKPVYDTITVHAKVKDANPEQTLHTETYKVQQGQSFKVEAPSITNYKLAATLSDGSAQSSVKSLSAEEIKALDPKTLTFYYEKAEADLVTITVEGKTAGGTALYSYTKDAHKSADAVEINFFTMNGYKLASVKMNNADVTKTGDVYTINPNGSNQTVTATYSDNLAEVTINAYYEGTTTTVDGFTPFKVKAEIGKPYSYGTLTLDGYDNADAATPSLTKVTGTDDHIDYHFTKQTGNVIYKLVDANDENNVLATSSVTVNKGNVIDKSLDKAPAATNWKLADNQTEGAVEGATADGKFDGVHTVTVTYKAVAKTKDVTIVRYDVDTNQIILLTAEEKNAGNTLTATLTTGTLHSLNKADYLPADYNISGNDKVEVYVEDDAEARTVNMYFRRSTDEVVTVNLYYMEDGVRHEIQSYVVQRKPGTTLTVKAPDMASKGYTRTTESKEVAPTEKTVEFEYTVQYNTVTITLEDENGTSLSQPNGYELTRKVRKGEGIVLTAPSINGYTLLTQLVVSKTAADLETAEGRKVTFKYQNTAAASYVTHTIILNDKDNGKEITRYKSIVAKGEGKTTYYAPVQVGYQVDKEQQEISNNRNDEVTFNYTKSAATITIKFVDKTGNALATQPDQILTGYEKGQTVMVAAPAVPSYALAGLWNGSLQTMNGVTTTITLSDTDTNNEVTFAYENRGQVHFVLKDAATGNDIQTINGEVGVTYGTAAGGKLDLTASGWAFDVSNSGNSAPFKSADQSVEVEAGKTESYTLYYTRMTRKVTYKYVDVTNGGREEITFTDPAENPKTANVGENLTVPTPQIPGYTPTKLSNTTFVTADSTGAVEVTFKYIKKETGSVTVKHILKGTDKVITSYTASGSVGEWFTATKLTTDANGITADGRYTFTESDSNKATQTVKVTAAEQTITFEYEPNYVMVNTYTSVDGVETEYQTGIEVVKTTGTQKLYAPSKTGYVLKGITVKKNVVQLEDGSVTTFPDYWNNNELTLTNLTSDVKVVYYYEKINDNIKDYQATITVKDQYETYELGGRTETVIKDVIAEIASQAYDGYVLIAYQIGDSADQKQWVKADKANNFKLTHKFDKDTTVTFFYGRADGSAVVPGEDTKFGTDDDVIIKPKDDNKPSVNPDSSVKVPNGAEVVTPNGTVIPPNGSIVKPDGTIVAPGTDGTTNPGVQIDPSDPGNAAPTYLYVKYMANGGKGEIPTQFFKKGDTVTIAANNFTADNKTADGWNTQEDGKGTDYAAGAKQLDKSLTLFAKWTANNYAESVTITFHANLTGVQDEQQTIGFFNGTSATENLRANTFVLNGWTFGGWSKQKVGSIDFADKAEFTFKHGDAAALDLYAQWYKQDGSSITVPGKDGDPSNENTNVTGTGNGIDRNPTTGVITIPAGGTITVKNPTTDKTETITLPNGGKLNPDGSYSINLPNNGGTIDVDKDGKEEVKGDDGTTKPNADVVTLTYEINNGENDVVVIKAVKGEEATAIANPFTYAGHVFLNWMANINGTVEEIAAGTGTFTPQDNVTLCAQWAKQNAGNGSVELPGKDGILEEPHDKDNVIVTPDNGGSLEGPKQPSGGFEVKDEDATVTRPDPTDPDSKEEIKVPEGTVIQPDGTIELPNGGTIGPDDKLPNDAALTDYVVVTYDPNGGTGNIIRQLLKKDEAAHLLGDDVFTAPHGSVFVNWLDEDNGTSFAANEEIHPTTNVTLKAQWKNGNPAPSYSAEIVFDSNTDEGTATQTVTSVDSETITRQLDPYADHFTAPAEWSFMGWSTTKASSQSSTFYEDEAKVTLNNGDTLNLYAVVYKIDADTKVVTLPGADGEPNTGDDVTVTPPADGTELTPGKGFIEAPAGSEITQPSGTIKVVEGTVTVYPDGSIVVPDGSKVTDKDGNEVTGPTTIDKDGKTDIDNTKPIQKPDGSIVIPGKDGVTGTPDDITVKPAGPNEPAGRTDDDGNVIITNPDGAEVTIPGNNPEEVKVPNGTVIAPNGDMTLVYTIKYVDASGNALQTAATVKIKVGATETVTAATISGYNVSGDASKTITGTVSADPNNYIITFTYTKKSSGGGGSSGGGSSSGGSSGGNNSGNNNGNNNGSNNGNNNGNGNNTTKPNDPSQIGVADWLRTDEHTTSMSGYGNGKFGPDNSVTRAQIAQIFYRLLKDQNVKITVNFTDVAEDAWYAKAVNTLGSLGIVSGNGSGKFNPNRAISRAEFCALATRFAKVASTVENPFSDIKESDWYYKAVTTAASYGWVTGMNDGKFHANDVISRAQAATIINRMLGAAADRSYVDSHVTNPYTDVSKTHWAYYQIMEATIAHDHGYDKEGVEIWKGLK